MTMCCRLYAIIISNMNSKHFFMAAFMATAPLGLSAQELIGQLSGAGADSLIVRLNDVEGSQDDQIDTIAIDAQGRFSYTMKQKVVTRVVVFPLRRQSAESNARPTYFDGILVPGETLKASGSFDKPVVEGGEFFTEYKRVKASLDAIIEEARALNAKYPNSMNNEEEEKKFAAERTAILDRHQQAILQYIKDHPDSDVSTALVPQLGMNSYDKGLALLTPRAREGRMAPLYRTGQRIIAEQKQKEDRLKGMDGKQAPLFTLPQPDGTPLALESLRGKYVVVDFWGSWCGWCIKGIPQMKEYYAKYKDKVEFVSIDCRDTEAKWKDALAKYEMPWKHVRCDEQCDMPEQYNILGYPTKAIVDPQGNIVKVVTGEDPEFYELLDKLLGA